MSLESFIRAMPKVELHVHLEGAIEPQTLLELSSRNKVGLPADSIEELRRWYVFEDFAHFAQVYMGVSGCICTPDDLELITRQFLVGQAAQNILYSEVTYTALTQYHFKGMAFRDQLAAINRARVWGEEELGVKIGLVIDIPRIVPEEDGLLVSDWAIGAMGDGVVALGLAGPEAEHPPERFAAAFDRAAAAGLARVPHAGETDGSRSIWAALRTLAPQRIGHGVRCLEDPRLVAELRARQIPLEVCPTSNVCLGVAPRLAEHPLPRLLAEGLHVTLNSDDPALFATTLTDEYLRVASTFGWGAAEIERLVLAGVRASLLPAAARATLEAWFVAELDRLRAEHLSG